MFISTTIAGIRYKAGTAAILLCIAALFGSCIKEPVDYHNGYGKSPVYLPVSEFGDITNLPPQDILQTGSIFLKDTLFYMLEFKKGIHVFNIKDSVSAGNLTFIQIPAITDFTISGDRLYADSWKDLVTIDISDLYHIRLLDRQTDVFTPVLYPPLYNGIFECVDESRGAVVGWEDAYLENARCTTLN